MTHLSSGRSTRSEHDSLAGLLQAIGNERGARTADLAHFLVVLHGIDASNGPAAGPHNFHRGGSLAIYDSETRRSIGTLAGEIDATAVTAVAICAWAVGRSGSRAESLTWSQSGPHDLGQPTG
jgi:aminoglycoside phosphotransferase (APT) family kinase protein